LLGATERARLQDVFEDAFRRGFLGGVAGMPASVEGHIDHSVGFAAALPSPALEPVASGEGCGLDLGTGAGIPGLVLAVMYPSSRWTLLDGSVTRATWLSDIVASMGLANRVTVVAERAEVVGRSQDRGTVDLVVARGFGGPAVTAECGAPLLRPGGHLAVAEPPGGRPERWPADGLSVLGLTLVGVFQTPVAVAIMRLDRPCRERFPRRTGIPRTRPLF
jgi:16S rRNA (guanine527-N7)-methyltransferase